MSASGSVWSSFSRLSERKNFGVNIKTSGLLLILSAFMVAVVAQPPLPDSSLNEKKTVNNFSKSDNNQNKSTSSNETINESNDSNENHKDSDRPSEKDHKRNDYEEKKKSEENKKHRDQKEKNQDKDSGFSLKIKKLFIQISSRF